ncbi:TPA: hypothetical protein ACGO88_000720 [Streptococcus suis]
MNLVKADWYRIRKERLSLVSLAILIVLSLILAYSSSQELTAVGAEDILSNWTNLLPLFFVAPAKIFFGEDFQFRTVNNSLVRTQNRLKIFTHKWLSSVGLCVFLFDQLFMMATGILLKTDFFADFMMFSQLSVAADLENLLSWPSILARIFSLGYFICGALLFSKKELK